MQTVIGHPIQQHVTFVGPYGVGKTTAVHRLSNTPVVRTEVLSSAWMRGGRQSAKRTTTVGIDYGEWHRRDGSRVALIGTPGQQRFRTVQRLVSARATAYVLLVYGDHDMAVEEAAEWLEYFGGDDIAHRLVLGVTRAGDGHPDIATYERSLGERGLHVPVLACDARNATDVARIVMAGVERGSIATARLEARRRRERHGVLTTEQRLAALTGSLPTGRGA